MGISNFFFLPEKVLDVACICIDEHEGDEAFGLVGALSFSLILPLFLFVMLFAMVTALHSGQKKKRKKRKNKTLHIIRNA
jgi:uncharacterized membrane protein